MRVRLILFDIDGTLIRTGGSGIRAIVEALETVFSQKFPDASWEAAGKIDRGIFWEMAQKMGATRADFEKRLPHLKNIYFEILKKKLKEKKPVVLPGVVDLLKALRERGSTVGLLTGNFKQGAEIKLDSVDLWSSFSFGAFFPRFDSRFPSSSPQGMCGKGISQNNECNNDEDL